MGLGNCTAASLRSHLSYGLEVLKAQRRGRPLSPFPVCLCLWRGRNEASYAVKGPHRSLPLSSASSPYTLLVFLGFVIRMRYQHPSELRASFSKLPFENRERGMVAQPTGNEEADRPGLWAPH